MIPVPPDLVRPGEVFKVHPGYPNFWVSDHGRVWSERGRRLVGRLGPGASQGKPYPMDKKYVQVTLESKTGRTEFVHTLVLETFVSARPEGHDGDHINHDRKDNRLSNLRWRLRSENRADTVR